MTFSVPLIAFDFFFFFLLLCLEVYSFLFILLGVPWNSKSVDCHLSKV